MQIFIIVAKSRPDLYDYFSSALSGLEEIQIIHDRRLESGDARLADQKPSEERRGAPDIYDELEARGFVIVRLPE